jgi:PAS domain S-box-containing protein
VSIQCYSDDGFVELLCRFRSDGAILFVNSAYARACGTTPQEMIHRSFWDFILPDDRNKVRAMLAELTPDNPEVRIENRFESVEGVRWTLWTNRGVAFDEAGTLLEATSSGVDITDLKRAEQALRESEDRRRIASEVAKVGTFEWDMRNDVIAWTRELEALYGLAPGEFGGTYEDWRRLVHPDDLPQAEVKLKQAETDGDFSAQWRVIWPDGSIHYLESRARIDFDEDGNAIRMLGANVDVSERVRTEIALRESELRFRTAAEAVSGIIYEYHYDTCRVERSCGLHAVLGFHQDEVRIHWNGGRTASIPMILPSRARLPRGRSSPAKALRRSIACSIATDTGSMCWTSACWCLARTASR